MPTHDVKNENPIWKRPVDVNSLNRLSAHCMVSHIGIRFVEIGPNYLKATMPVDRSTSQPFGLLHGGASVALAETLGSAAAICAVDESRICVGVEINANHIRSARGGKVTGTTRPIHLGSTLHVWQTDIVDDEGNLISTGRMTLAVLDARND